MSVLEEAELDRDEQPRTGSRFTLLKWVSFSTNTPSLRGPRARPSSLTLGIENEPLRLWQTSPPLPTLVPEYRRGRHPPIRLNASGRSSNSTSSHSQRLLGSIESLRTSTPHLSKNSFCFSSLNIRSGTDALESVGSVPKRFLRTFVRPTRSILVCSMIAML